MSKISGGSNSNSSWSGNFILTHFLPRDATHKRGLYRRVMSVCLSVTFEYFAKPLKPVIIS